MQPPFPPVTRCDYLEVTGLEVFVPNKGLRGRAALSPPALRSQGEIIF